MENKLTPELLEKAKQAKTPEELIALAKENNTELTAEEAKEYFEKLSPKSGELSDEELDNVAGGGCGGGDPERVHNWDYCCEHFVCDVSRMQDPSRGLPSNCCNCMHGIPFSNDTVECNCSAASSGTGTV